MKEFDEIDAGGVTLMGGETLEPKKAALFPGSERLSPKVTRPVMGAADPVAVAASVWKTTTSTRHT